MGQTHWQDLLPPRHFVRGALVILNLIQNLSNKHLAYLEQRLTELGFGSVDDFFDTKTDAPKYLEDCFPAYVSRSLVEMYMEFDSIWHVHFLVGSSNGPTRKTYIIDNRNREHCLTARPYEPPLRVEAPSPIDRNESRVRNTKFGHKSEPAMLIRIAQIGKYPEQVLTDGSVAIRLIPLHKCPLVSSKNFGNPPTLEYRIGGSKRKIDEAPFFAAHAANQAQFVGNVVESCSVVLDAITDDQSQRRRDWLDHIDAPDWGIAIAILRNATGITIDKFLQDSFVSVQMFIAPAKFGFRPGESVRHRDGMIPRSPASQSGTGSNGQ